ncbi:MAG: SdpI family protein [Clostridia bacterium]|nr:SdpI family protein [Clostridia bacterium]
MLKANKKTLILTSLVMLIPVVIGLIFWSRLPDPMAIHFGADNEANGFAAKPVAVFAFPLGLLALQWLMPVLLSLDPKRKNISPKMTALVLWLIPIISVFVCAFMYAFNLGYPVNITFFAELMIGLIFIVVGNYLPKTRQNYMVGIRLPWTLANEENWNRTSRLAGPLMIVGGLLIVILTLTGTLTVLWLLLIFAVLLLVPIIYSCWLHLARGL